MDDWKVGCLLAVASLAMVFFTYHGCMAIVQIDAVLPRWAREHGFRIIRREAGNFFQGPFPFSKACPTYFVIVEDQQQKQRKGWIRLGVFYFVGFKEKIEVIWEE